MADTAKELTANTLAFFNALSTAEELTHLDVRIGWRLLTRLNSKVRRSWPSYETLAEDCHVNRRSAMRSLCRLERYSWFYVDRMPGRSHTNRYTPNWEKVTRQSPFNGTVERVSPEKVTGESTKGDPNDTEKVTVVSPDPIDMNLSIDPIDRLAGKFEIREEPEAEPRAKGKDRPNSNPQSTAYDWVPEPEQRTNGTTAPACIQGAHEADTERKRLAAEQLGQQAAKAAEERLQRERTLEAHARLNAAIAESPNGWSPFMAITDAQMAAAAEAEAAEPGTGLTTLQAFLTASDDGMLAR